MTLSRFSLAAWVVLTPMLCLLYLTVPPSPDQALFDYIAWSHLQGDTYYVGVAEQNWPGKMFLHEVGIRIFGTHFWTFRAIDFAAMQLFTGAAALFLARSGFRAAPWVFLLLYPALYVTAGGWMAGQRDIVAAGLLVAAGALMVPVEHRHPRAHALNCMLAGALVSLAVIFRPTYLTFLAIMMAVEAGLLLAGKQSIGRATGRVSLLGIGFAIPMAALLWAGQHAGALDDFYQQTILFNIESYQVAQSRLRLCDPLFFQIGKAWHWIALLATVGLMLWIRSGRGLQSLVLVLGLAGTILISYFFQNKGFGYHLGGLLLVFCLLIGVAFEYSITGWRKATTARTRMIATSALIGITLLTAAGTAKKITNILPQDNLATLFPLIPNDRDQGGMSWQETSRVIALITEKTTEQDYVLQWGRNFSLPFLAERRSPTRFVSTSALYVMSPAFSGYDDWLAEVVNDLEVKRPAAVIVATELLPPRQAGRFVAPQGAHPIENILGALLNSYKPALTNDHVTVFVETGS